MSSSFCRAKLLAATAELAASAELIALASGRTSRKASTVEVSAESTCLTLLTALAAALAVAPGSNGRSEASFSVTAPLAKVVVLGTEFSVTASEHGPTTVEVKPSRAGTRGGGAGRRHATFDRQRHIAPDPMSSDVLATFRQDRRSVERRFASWSESNAAGLEHLARADRP